MKEALAFSPHVKQRVNQQRDDIGDALIIFYPRALLPPPVQNDCLLLKVTVELTEADRGELWRSSWKQRCLHEQITVTKHISNK